MERTDEYRVEVLTGCWQLAAPEARAQITALMGASAEADFDTYFHWYNIVHELGHAVFMFNCPARPHPAQEEQLVNDIAVAYWRHYGEEEKLRALERIVRGMLARLGSPAAPGQSHIDYARALWGTEALNTFESYGYFQFSCVAASLAGGATLTQALKAAGVAATPQPRCTLRYSADGRMHARVLRDAARELMLWGAALPEEVNVRECVDLNCHMCLCERRA